MRRLSNLLPLGTAAARTTRSDEGLRRVAGRLAIQTVLLLLVMLVVLEIIVYLAAQRTLVSSLKTTLQNRSQQADPTVCRYFHLPCAPGGPGGGQAQPARSAGKGQPSGTHGQGNPGGAGGQGLRPGGRFTGPSIFKPVAGPSEASAVYLNRRLQIVDYDGVLGHVVLNQRDVRESMQSAQPECCPVQSYKGESYLLYTAPLVVNGNVIGAVQTSISEHQYLQLMDGLLQTLIIVALLGLLGSAGISVALAGRALRPIRLAMQRQRDFVADAAHELRTPLAIQRTVAEIETPDPTIEDLQATVAQMLGENRHLTRLVEDLSLLARTDTDALRIERDPVDLSTLLTTTSEEIAFLAADKGIALGADIRDGVTVSGDLLRLRQLVLILLDNAMKHTPNGGSISVRLATEGGRAALRVADSGPGIPARDLNRVFDRFYRADEAREGEGTGLGLAIARWIVEAHGGQISAGNVSPHGAVFTVTLPVTRVPVTA